MLLYVTALVVLIADLVTKEFAHRALLAVPGNRVPVIPGFFDFYLQYNTGAAFSILREHPEIITGFSMVAIVVIFLWGRTLPRDVISIQLSIGMFMGGGLGNLVDRVRFGKVIDFLHFFIRDAANTREWAFPTFNIADCAITVGISVFLFLALFTKKLEPAKKPDEPTGPVGPGGPSEDPERLAATASE